MAVGQTEPLAGIEEPFPGDKKRLRGPEWMKCFRMVTDATVGGEDAEEDARKNARRMVSMSISTNYNRYGSVLLYAAVRIRTIVRTSKLRTSTDPY